MEVRVVGAAVAGPRTVDCRRGRPLSGVIVIAAAAIGFSGCGNQKIPLSKVTGRVTLNGVPAEAEVVFQPVNVSHETSGRPSMASTNSDGNFVLDYAESQPGAPLGHHRVTITVIPSGESAEAQPTGSRPLIGKIARFERDVVKGQRNHFPFELTY